MTTIIVSRHSGAITWIRSKGFDGTIVSQFKPEMAEAGDTIIGVLPVPLIKTVLDRGATFILLSLPAIAFGQRGEELTPEEMSRAGARLDRVTRIEMEEL